MKENGEAPDTRTPARPAVTLTYATSREFPAEPGAITEVYRQDDTMIARNGATLPGRCAVCGCDTPESPVRLPFNWDSSFRRTRVSTLEIHQRAYVYVCFCPPHFRRWRRVRAAGTFGTGVGVASLVAGLVVAIWSESSVVPLYTPLGITLIIGGFGMMTASMFFFSLGSRTLSCRRVTDGYVYIDGAAEELLAQLSPLPDNHGSA